MSQEPPDPTAIVSPESTGTTAPPVENGNPLRPIPPFLKNLANGFRLAFFRRVEEERVPVAWWQVAVFALASLLAPLLYDFASIGLSGEFEWWKIPSALAHLPVILFAAIAAAYALGKGEKTLLLLQSFLMIALAIDLAVYTAQFAVHAVHPHRIGRLFSGWPNILPPVWFTAACGRAATRLFPASPRRVARAYAACALLVLPFSGMYSERDLWRLSVDDSGASSSANYKGLEEDVLYNQPALLQRELAAVRPGRPGVIDVYFVGMGGYGYQDVFMKEVNAVSRLFRERFGSEGKTIRLVNNAKTLAASPVATVTSLRASLKRVAEVMDKKEDVLFLFLTSHGSETHHFSLDLWPLHLRELNPPVLRNLLDESGIRNRVVVVSACYSGGFIEPLKSENTLVISASAADRNSFGCSNEAEWTYFGKAYFDEALRKSYSFVEAFDIAKPAVAEREKKDGYKPSEPQMALGEKIKPRLATLQRQLAARR